MGEGYDKMVSHLKTPSPKNQKPAELSVYPATRWSLVIQANEASDDNALSALGELCQSYWYPLYVCARRSGLSPSDSEDCVQSFLGRLLEKRSFETVAEERGRLRAFLQAAMKNFLTQQWHKGQHAHGDGSAL